MSEDPKTTSSLPIGSDSLPIACGPWRLQRWTRGRRTSKWSVVRDNPRWPFGVEVLGAGGQPWIFETQGAAWDKAWNLNGRPAHGTAA
jgi:hypothetical protein